MTDDAASHPSVAEPRRRGRTASAGFVVCWLSGLGATALGVAPLAIVFVVLGLASWAAAMKANVDEGRARLEVAPQTTTGLPRQRVAKGLVLSWLIPGTGDWYLGLNRRRAFSLIVIYLLLAIPTWSQLVPVWMGVVSALPVWFWGQYVFRHETGWGWRPLLPSWGELLASEPDEPSAFARGSELPPDDPRRDWAGRT